MTSEENKLEVAKELLRYCEAKIESQVNASLAAVQRATASAAGLVAICAIFAAINTPHLDGLVKLSSMTLFLIAAVFAVSSAKPRKLEMLGHRYRKLKSELEENMPLLDVLVAQMKEYDDRIDDNDKILKKEADLFMSSMWIALCGAVVPLIAIILKTFAP